MYRDNFLRNSVGGYWYELHKWFSLFCMFRTCSSCDDGSCFLIFLIFVIIVEQLCLCFLSKGYLDPPYVGFHQGPISPQHAWHKVPLYFLLMGSICILSHGAYPIFGQSHGSMLILLCQVALCFVHLEWAFYVTSTFCFLLFWWIFSFIFLT